MVGEEVRSLKVALFDFDGTLCPGDSIVPYLRFCIHEGIAPRSQWLQALAGYMNQKIHPEAVSAAKARSLSFIHGKSKAEMVKLAERFFRECLQPRFYTEGDRTLKKLRDEGIKTIVLSASASVYMDVLPKFLPVDVVLSTPCELDQNGIYTGAVGPNCRDKEKIDRLHAWANSDEIKVVYAYGDSTHDVPMLSLAQHPVWVNPSRKVLNLLQAETVNWKGGTSGARD